MIPTKYLVPMAVMSVVYLALAYHSTEPLRFTLAYALGLGWSALVVGGELWATRSTVGNLDDRFRADRQ